MGDREPTYTTLVTGPTERAVTLAEAKAHLRVDTAASDDQITQLLLAAEAYLDGANGTLGRALRPQTWKVTARAFPNVVGTLSPFHSDHFNYDAVWRLPLPPFVSVTSVEYVNQDGHLQTWDAANYVAVDTGLLGAIVMPAEGVDWPTTRGTMSPDNARVTFECGYASADSPEPEMMPQTIRAAIMLMLNSWYDRPGEQDMPEIVKTLVAPYKARWVG